MANTGNVIKSSAQYKPNGRLIILLILLITFIFSRPVNADTSIYVFGPDQSTVVQSGGFAGVHETYTITGQYRLSVDSDTSVALFEIVDANLTDETGAVYGQSLNEIFNMTGLAGTLIDDMTIEFEGKAADGTQSDVNLILTLNDGLAQLTGQYTPPPDSADLFFYDVNAVAIRKYDGGTGEPNEPYLISTAGQLNTIGAELGDWDKHFKLIADIDLQEYSGEQFNIIGTMRDKFVGSIDGAGFTISNFRYSAGNLNFIGLFSQVGTGAQIKDVILDNVEIEVEKGASIGALVGFNLRGVISNCCVSGSVIGGDGSGNLGALVGFNSWGTVSNCGAAGSVTGASNVASIGGLVGNNAHGDIYDCTATTTVSGGPGSSDIGGLVGYSDAGTISNSFAAGNVSGYTSLGGLVGYKNDGSIIQCYAIGNVSGNTRLGGLVGRNDSGIVSDCYATGSIDGDDALGGLVGRNHKGSVSYCYAVGTVNGNSRFGGLVGNEDRGSYISSFWNTDTNPALAGAGDIDPDPNDIFGKTTAEMQTESTFLEAGWDFINETENGVEDVWKIEDLDYPRLSWEKYSGGSGTPDNPYQIATAEDLATLGESPEDYDKHFILTADIDLDINLSNGKVFDRAVIAPDTNDTETGFQGTGFTGILDGNCHTISHLTVQGHYYLGLFGRIEPGANVRNIGVVDVNIVSSGSYAGGLVGQNSGNISVSYSTGVVNGGRCVGGLVGCNSGNGDISNCSSNCMVSGFENIGGLLGHNGHDYSGLVTKCFSTGPVTGVEDVGGLVGDNDASVTDSFWDVETSTRAHSDGGTGKTTAEMQMASTFLEAGWDFVGETKNGTEDIWWIFEGRDYPRFWWEQVLGDDFEDGEAGSLWQVYEPDSEKIRVEETNRRLEVLANDTVDDIVAGYISNGWRLDVTSDFALRADFHFSKIEDGDSWVMILLLPSLNEPAERFTVLEAGCLENQPNYLHEIEENGSIIHGESVSRSTDDGTLYISYNSDMDEIYLSFTGYGQAKAWQTVEGLLQDQWAAQPVYVVIGGGSDQVLLDTGDAYLDNFTIDSGVLDFTAEPNDSGDL